MTAILLDQGIPRSAVAYLRETGFDADHVGELGMSSASDDEILQKAQELNAVVVTLDSDFHTLLASRQATRPSVIRIRIEGMKGIDVSEVVNQVFSMAHKELEMGSAVSVTRSQVRIRLLPIA